MREFSTLIQFNNRLPCLAANGSGIYCKCTTSVIVFLPLTKPLAFVTLVLVLFVLFVYNVKNISMFLD